MAVRCARSRKRLAAALALSQAMPQNPSIQAGPRADVQICQFGADRGRVSHASDAAHSGGSGSRWRSDFARFRCVQAARIWNETEPTSDPGVSWTLALSAPTRRRRRGRRARCRLPRCARCRHRSSRPLRRVRRRSGRVRCGCDVDCSSHFISTRPSGKNQVRPG